MSAAVVPGAKFEAVTGKGPALPFMLRPRGVFLGVVMLAWSGVRAEEMREERERKAVEEELRGVNFGRCEDTLVVDEDLWGYIWLSASS